jgi:hypothetical protein
MLGKTIVKIVSLSVFLALAACTGQVAAATVKTPTATTPAQPTSVSGAQTASVSQTAATAAPAPSPGPKPSGKIKVTEITPTVSVDSVSVPVSTVQSKWNTHFLVDTKAGTIGFMAYVLDDKIIVRASICPPCRGKTYTLDGSKLVCDTCGTVFDAVTGKGISGACVNYPKDSVAYQISGGNLVMKIDDMIAAYQDTLKPG